MNPKDEIKEKLSILEVVSTYVRLDKAGNQYRGKCPFHNERTPSFYVSPERKTYHCFGCGAHGDIFSFVEKIESIPFYEALKILADRSGISLKDSNRNKEESRLVSLLSDATIYFQKCLTESGEASSYLAGRGINKETIKTFQIGYSKNEWRTLFIHLAQLGYSPEEMEEAGVVIKALDSNGKVKGWYDRFRGRVMFPIRNVSSATVGYSGRILPQLVDETQAQGKYVNTPETPLYHKSKILFGYDTAKKKMSETKEVIVVEGQMDLCMSHQAGIHNTIAVSGTAFTDEHIKLIKRFADKVVLSFDSDNAGQNALNKTALACLYSGLDVYVVPLSAKDPADMIQENSASWISAIEKKVHVVEHLTGKIIDRKHDPRILRQEIVREVMPFISALRSAVDRDYFISKVSQLSGITTEALREECQHIIPIEANKDEPTIKLTLPSRERRFRELVAFVTWKKLHKHEKVIALNIFPHEFPDEIVEKEIVALERFNSSKDVESTLEEFVRSYEREILKERQAEIQILLRDPSTDHEDLLTEYSKISKALQNSRIDVTNK